MPINGSASQGPSFRLSVCTGDRLAIEGSAAENGRPDGRPDGRPLQGALTIDRDSRHRNTLSESGAAHGRLVVLTFKESLESSESSVSPGPLEANQARTCSVEPRAVERTAALARATPDPQHAAE
ncbi:hypothetical protein F503_00359 [Ophiostoma piceae UAMH 11346]|uniref:Uncharacterized protein n=1 Tax=Ophiostoma piceae (strain UAMH 11346) TaxID=1262450 RepID=S3C4B2_OPHP1|nr:hypothetical protein F503_00359 [Ophiostoma piceae UAMH 11346]